MVLLQNLKSSFNSRRGSIFGSPPKPWASFSLFLHRLSSTYSSLPFPFLLPRKYFCFPFPRYFLVRLQRFVFLFESYALSFFLFHSLSFFFLFKYTFFHRYSNFLINFCFDLLYYIGNYSFSLSSFENDYNLVFINLVVLFTDCIFHEYR